MKRLKPYFATFLAAALLGLSFAGCDNSADSPPPKSKEKPRENQGNRNSESPTPEPPGGENSPGSSGSSGSSGSPGGENSPSSPGSSGSPGGSSGGSSGSSGGSSGSSGGLSGGSSGSSGGSSGHGGGMRGGGLSGRLRERNSSQKVSLAESRKILWEKTVREVRKLIRHPRCVFAEFGVEGTGISPQSEGKYLVTGLIVTTDPQGNEHCLEYSCDVQFNEASFELRLQKARFTERTRL